MPEIAGYVEKIKFRNEENGYSVLSVISQGKEFIFVGNFHYIGEGEYIKARGTIRVHPSYGEQLLVESYEVSAPEDTDSIERYLASSAIKGVGEALAARIVKKFKGDTLRVMEEEPERLSEVKGISEKLALSIGEQVEEKKDMRDAMIYLQKYGLSMNLSAKIYKEYGSKVYSVIETNPYKLAEDIAGVGFKTADDIAKKAGIQADSRFRAMAGLQYLLSAAMLSGHLYLPRETLLREGEQLLTLSQEELSPCVSELEIQGKIVVRKTASSHAVFLASCFYAEASVAKMLLDINTFSQEDPSLMERVEAAEKKSKIRLDDLQKQAVAQAASAGVMILTGGPGTGKTTTINTMLSLFEEAGMEILLAAPTGRAAKRMSEATGWEAKTIHRLLEVMPATQEEGEGPGTHFEKNEASPLEADVVIIDEASMVDIFLMQALLKAIAVGTRLVLAGDIHQLPSVGAGNVLKDLIESGQFYVVELKNIYRQALESDIIMNAHRMMEGEEINLAKKSRDFLFIKQTSSQRVTETLLTLIKDKLPGYVKARPFEIQVMTPMRRGPLGVEALNSLLQQFLNPAASGKREREGEFTLFREGDKVMQVKNNYQREWKIYGRRGMVREKGMGVYNGDMGRIAEINLFAQTLEIEFDDRKRVVYPFHELSEIELSYAITIHKSQGSEYPAVIIPVFFGPPLLMTRNLIYTAITRAQKCVVLVGDPQAFYDMVHNTAELQRYTGLKERILEYAQTTLP